ncbi:hypothetical protein ACFVAV_16940 [Nocardia sp. NPDC057663]|uniref:hypothetical protein n=1 Tax=Nocardia sp. NPDC057663 TaxID=3346201 RepID=UPI00366CF0CF
MSYPSGHAPNEGAAQPVSPAPATVWYGPDHNAAPAGLPGHLDGNPPPAYGAAQRGQAQPSGEWWQSPGPVPVSAQGYGAAPAYGMTPHPMPGDGQPRPSGGTAITAGVIAVLMSLCFALLLVDGVIAMAAGHLGLTINGPFLTAPVLVIVRGVITVLYMLGSILLFRRRAAGRSMLIVAASLALIQLGITLVMVLGIRWDADLVAAIRLNVALSGGPALLILGLVAAPSTGRWIREGRRRSQPYGY